MRIQYSENENYIYLLASKNLESKDTENIPLTIIDIKVILFIKRTVKNLSEH